MATSTVYSYLMYDAGTGSTHNWTKVCDIKDYPDLGGTPEMIETTTLSNSSQTFVPGVEQSSDMTFTANYDATDFTTVKALSDGTDKHFAVWFGRDDTGSSATHNPDGHEGKFSFDGKLSVFVAGGGVNDPREMTISITRSTDVTFAAT